jgi:YHS domain-containing protein
LEKNPSTSENEVIKCKFCDAEVANEKCMFAIYKRVIDSKEYYFCSEIHANEFEEQNKKEF